MSATSEHVFDATVHKTNKWLRDIMLELDWDDRHRAYHALRAVLHTLRDRLPNHEAVDFGAQLPMLVRGLYYEGWKLDRDPRRLRKEADFLRQISEAFHGDVSADAEQITRAVFSVISQHVTAGEVRDIIRNLPDDLRMLWDYTP